CCSQEDEITPSGDYSPKGEGPNYKNPSLCMFKGAVNVAIVEFLKEIVGFFGCHHDFGEDVLTGEGSMLRSSRLQCVDSAPGRGDKGPSGPPPSFSGTMQE
ncbi:hypothetical protein KUCAC02_006381, partial [Chaenocephalus aceratus]